MSAIGSVIIAVVFLYQLDLRTPGISPRSDFSRKQIRQRPNFRRKARGLPQR
jgi:hypothetical protein